MESDKTSTHTVLKLPGSISITDEFQRDNGSLKAKDGLSQSFRLELNLEPKAQVQVRMLTVRTLGG